MKKRVLYSVFSALLTVAAICAEALMFYFAIQEDYADWRAYAFSAAVIVVNAILPLHLLIHEAGHLLFGLFCRNRFVYFRVWWLAFSKENKKTRVHFTPNNSTAGETAFYPTKTRGVKARFLWTTLGGAALNFLYAAIFFCLYFLLPAHPVALLFFEAIAPLNLSEGICALIPAELNGKTDGAVARGILRSSAEETVALRVLTAQAILFRGSFSEIDEPLLFDTPVVREDLPAFHALLMLRVQYLLANDRKEEAKREIDRLRELSEYLDEGASEQVMRYFGWFEGEFTAQEGIFYGVKELEKRLQDQIVKRKDMP